jgi:hypothetical protein
MNPRLLTVLMVFIGSTLGAAAGAKLGKPIAFTGGLIGAAFGWAAARVIWRKIF